MAFKLKPLPLPSYLHSSPRQNPNFTLSNRSLPRFFSAHSLPRFFSAHSLPLGLSLSTTASACTFHRNAFVTARAFRSDEITDEGQEEEKEEQVSRQGEKKELANQGILDQIKEIVMFTGPATGLWICAPLMSLIDTAIIGQRSSIELAALGPATVVCDYMSYVFMFLSIATSNMVATALAKQDKQEVQHHISILVSVGLSCGVMMLLFTRLFGSAIITAFTGSKNAHIVPAASSYVKIRGLAWPALLVGWVSQSFVDPELMIRGLNIDIMLKIIFVVAACMMIKTLNKKGYNALAFSIPSGKELLMIFGLAAPVFMTMMSKVAFYSLLIYFATSLGTHTMAAHQVMVQTYSMCTVWGEPLSQTAQSFMPELIYGANRSLSKAQLLLRSLLTIGIILGLLLGIVGTSVPWLFPYIFTPDRMVIQEMHKVLIPYFIALSITPPTHSLEGTLLAGRDLRFISLSMTGCFCVGSLLLWAMSSRFGLLGCWFSLAIFQWARFSIALQRLLSPKGVLYSGNTDQHELRKLRTT
ncbi:Protein DETOXIFICATION 46 [Vigna angularis]|uniref:Protein DETOXIFICATION n=1 Tax=Phaseolus angularis TaxID=3914 RepID=A0A8T0KFE4_PHAAN|nr:Protein DETOXIFICATION 46 [Vigna angularis]